MNKKISGVKAVLVKFSSTGYNYFPFVEDLKDRTIKYIDFYPVTYLPDTNATGCTVYANMFLNLADKTGNAFPVRNMPLQRYTYSQTMGVRQAVNMPLSLPNCYVDIQNSSAVGTTGLFVFYYDLPQYSAANKTDYTCTDAISIPLKTGVRGNLLPDEERLAGKRFRQVLLSCPATTPDFASGISAAKVVNCYLTLQKGSYKVVDNMPLALLFQLDFIEKTQFANIIFDLQSSYVTIGGAGTISDLSTNYVGKSVFLNLVYEK